MTELSKEQKQLYPFLEGGKSDPRSLQAGLLRSIADKAQASIAVKESFFAEQSDSLLKAAELIASVYAGHGRLFVIGNGGSSCDAAHFAVEFQHPVTAGRQALSATNLSADSALLSALGNDLGFQHVFSRQLEFMAKPGDGLVAFSTSGNSLNLLEAFRKARQLSLTTIAFCGGDGGKLLEDNLVDCALIVKTDSIHRVQETHVTCYHIIWDLVHTLLADSRGVAGGEE